jgi:flagellar hook-associated protein 3 FlgL
MSDYISTQYLSSSLQLSVLRMQTELATAQSESASGQYADIGLQLGAQAGQEISLQNENGLLQTYTTTNSAVATSLSTTQSALDTIRTNAQNTLNSLTEWSGTSGTGTDIQTLGATGLQSLIATANTSVNGQYVFGGINSAVPPMAAYAAGTPAQTAIQSAFSTFLGTLPPIPIANPPPLPAPQTQPVTAATITGTQMQAFLADPSLTSQFQSPAWASNWSSASSTNISANISPTETITSTTNTNQPGFQQLAEGYALLNEFTGASVNPAALQVVASQATSLINQALTSLTTTEATIGAAQQRVTDANTNMSAQMTILQTQIGNLDNVNLYQTSTLVSTLTTQIQTAYSLTANLQKLSLVNYL